MSLKQLLRDHRDDIVARFVRDVRDEQLAPLQLPASVLVDRIPAFLDEIADELVHDEGPAERETSYVELLGRQHGEERWKAGYDLEAVVREYGTLRHAIYEVANAVNLPMSVGEFETLARYLNVGIAGATAQYVRTRDAQSKASQADLAELYELTRSERARADAATRAKDEFVAVVSHELRTPLNVIIGWMRLLRGGSLSDKTREHALEVVERNAAAQNQLVADLLDISRVLTGKVRLDPAQVDLGSLVTLVLEDARLALDAKRLQLQAEIGEATLMRGDAERLKQVIWNLLLNAIKFTHKGGAIHVTLHRVESDLELVFVDDGVGIAADALPHIFESFHQSDGRTTRAHGGLGIGLSITKHLVDLHGGTIDAQSDGVGKGARFTVRLPVSPVISTTVGIGRVPVTPAKRPELSRRDLLVGMHVLIVDDEDDARDLLRITLESCGARVSDAASAREALEHLAGDRADVVVSDIGMPEQDGYSLIRAIRLLADSDRAATPAIALTAFARNEDRTRALLAGFNVHMAKPVEPAELLVTIADLGLQRDP